MFPGRMVPLTGYHDWAVVGWALQPFLVRWGLRVCFPTGLELLAGLHVRWDHRLGFGLVGPWVELQGRPQSLIRPPGYVVSGTVLNSWTGCLT